MTASDFWSRRKAAVQAEEAALAEAAVDAQVHEAPAPEDDGALLQELGLPDPDTLGAGDDFTAFMAKAVPHHLRSRALRRLWTSNPILANVDGLVDYAEDFTDAATVLPGMQTAYQVGKGMTRHVEAMLAEQEAETEAEDIPTEDVEADAPQTEDEPGLLAARDTAAQETLIPVEDDASLAPPSVDDTPPMPRRHMRFDYS